MKLKRILAVAMATTMVMGMSLTAFAADGDTTGTGSGTGTGSSEGHVEQKHMNVVLPTDADTTTFAYTMDPERLIQTTSGDKYAAGTTFPKADADTGVYFLTGEKTYSNESNELQIINKSSHDIKVDVKVKTTATDGSTDIPLATAALESTETDPKLYLAAVVGEGNDATTQILSATEATVTKKLAGNSDNYQIVVQENSTSHEKEYVYKQKTSGLTAWKALKFKVKGEVSKATIAGTTTAPKITVTWSFAEPGQSDTNLSTDGVGTYSEDSAPSIANTNVSITANTAATIPVNLGAGSLAATTVKSAVLNGTGTLELLDGSGTFATYSNGTLTLTAALASFIADNPTVTLDVVFDDDAETTINVEFTVE